MSTKTEISKAASVLGRMAIGRPKKLTAEELAVVSFKLANRPVIHQANGRGDNKPILKKLDSTLLRW